MTRLPPRMRAVLPALCMTAFVAAWEAARPAPPPAAVSSAHPTSLPELPAPPLRAGTWEVDPTASRLVLVASDLLGEHRAELPTVTGDLHLGGGSALSLEVDLRPLLAAGADPWQAELLYALLDARADSRVRLHSRELLAHKLAVPGVTELVCDGTLTLHGHSRRVRLPLSACAIDRDHARLHAAATIDTRWFGLPVSYRYGVLPVDPVVRVQLDLVAIRTGPAR